MDNRTASPCYTTNTNEHDYSREREREGQTDTETETEIETETDRQTDRQSRYKAGNLEPSSEQRNGRHYKSKRENVKLKPAHRPTLKPDVL